MPDIQDFLDRYPEFNRHPEKVSVFLSDAKLEIDGRHWGKLYCRGVLALTAHLLKLDELRQLNDGGANRPLAAESAGELSVSYATPTGAQAGDDFYHLTAYGQEFLRLRKLVGIGVMVV